MFLPRLQEGFSEFSVNQKITPRSQLLASLSPLSKCPLSALPQVHFCAARGTDHTRCCREAKIPQTCEVFCDQAGLLFQFKVSVLAAREYNQLDVGASAVFR